MLGSMLPLSCLTHSGLSVATTNKRAKATVTAWEKMSHVLRINEILFHDATLRTRVVPGHAAGGGEVPRLWAERFAGRGQAGGATARLRRDGEPGLHRGGHRAKGRCPAGAPRPVLERT